LPEPSKLAPSLCLSAVPVPVELWPSLAVLAVEVPPPLGVATGAVPEAGVDDGGPPGVVAGLLSDDAGLSTRQIFVLTSFTERALSAVSQAGMVNNLNDGLAWGVFPLFFAAHGLSVARIGVLAALYPGVWGLGQLVTGTLSDHWGRKWLIAAGMWTQAIAIGLIAAVEGFAPWAVGAILLGIGTAMVYPTLLAAVGDVAHPTWRASSVGVYRLWRDGGFAVEALLAGVVADQLGLAAAIWVVAVLTAASGVVVAVRMYETHGATERGGRSWT
jgi:MFS family permease